MKKVFALASLVAAFLTAPLSAEKVVREISWSALKAEGRQGIEGRAYLEMWSFFAGGGRYFSRTLARVGPMAFRPWP